MRAAREAAPMRRAASRATGRAPDRERSHPVEFEAVERIPGERRPFREG